MATVQPDLLDSLTCSCRPAVKPTDFERRHHNAGTKDPEPGRLEMLRVRPHLLQDQRRKAASTLPLPDGRGAVKAVNCEEDPNGLCWGRSSNATRNNDCRMVDANANRNIGDSYSYSCCGCCSCGSTEARELYASKDRPYSDSANARSRNCNARRNPTAITTTQHPKILLLPKLSSLMLFGQAGQCPVTPTDDLV